MTMQLAQPLQRRRSLMLSRTVTVFVMSFLLSRYVMVSSGDQQSLFWWTTLLAVRLVVCGWIGLFASRIGSLELHMNLQSKTDQVKAIAKELTSSSWWENLYIPTPWLWDGNLQTIYMALNAKAKLPQVRYKREKFFINSSPRPGFVFLDWVDDDRDANSDILVFAPGMGDTHSGSFYVRIFASYFEDYRFVVVNKRGCGGAEAVNGQLYGAHYTDDLRSAILYISKENPSSRLFLLGCSMGANIVTKYMGEEGSDALITAAAALGAPFDIALCERLMSRNYSKSLTESMVELVVSQWKNFRPKEDIEEMKLSLNKIKDAKNLREFDEQYTRRAFQYDSVDDYYMDVRCAPVIKSIGVPTLLLCTLDDPVCVPEAIPFEECLESPHVILAVTNGGGHGMGWFQGLKPTSWSAPLVERFFRSVDSTTKKHH